MELPTVKQGQAVAPPERKCIACGCTESRACIVNDADGNLIGCSWAAAEVCTACAPLVSGRRQERASVEQLHAGIGAVLERAVDLVDGHVRDELNAARMLLTAAVESLAEKTLDETPNLRHVQAVSRIHRRVRGGDAVFVLDRGEAPEDQ